MPNWCENVVTVLGEEPDVRAFVAAAADDETHFSFERLLDATVNDTGAAAPTLVALADQRLTATYRFDTAWNRPENELRSISAKFPRLVFHTYEIERGNYVAGFLTLHGVNAVFEYELDPDDEPLQLLTTDNAEPLALLRPWYIDVVEPLDPTAGTPTFETLEALLMAHSDFRSLLVWPWDRPVAGALSAHAVQDETAVHSIAISPSRLQMAKRALADPEGAFACDDDWQMDRETLLRGLTDLPLEHCAEPPLNGPRLLLSLTDRIQPDKLDDALLPPLLDFPLAQLAALALHLPDPYELAEDRTPEQTATLLRGALTP